MAKAWEIPMTQKLSRRALMAGVSVAALAGVPAVAAVNPDADTLDLARGIVDRFRAMDRLVGDLRSISGDLPAGTYVALQFVADRIEREVFARNPVSHSLDYWDDRYLALFAKIGGAA
jgi:hypothetical protein